MTKGDLEKITNTMRHIRMLEERKELIGGKRDTLGTRVQTSYLPDPTSTTAAMIADIDAEIDSLVNDIKDLIEMFDKIIKTCPEPHILEMRFLNGYSTYKIAEITGMSRWAVWDKINAWKKKEGL